jgi:hypothetical protein
MKKIMLSMMMVAGLSVAGAAFAENSTVYYPDNSPVVQGSVQSSKTRAQVKAELKKAESSGQMKQLDNTVFFGH